MQAPERWPRPDFDDARPQPRFLFIVTPPYSGSTALAELINTSSKTLFLHAGGEGQWLVPGMCEKPRWDPARTFDFESIKAVWLSRYQSLQSSAGSVDTVIEKSPPNMLRLDRFVEVFDDVAIMANNRQPHAHCSSVLFRNHAATELSSSRRLEIVRDAAHGWLKRSELIAHIVEKYQAPLLTYEQFCKDPARLLDRLPLPSHVTADIDTNASVSVKDYAPQAIVDQNQKQVARLSDEEIQAVDTVVASRPDLLTFFSYSLSP
ncbi:conserved hypothetical protein [Luminiphilus syltensis NOR5-1B]|uniref:Sulfotransferase family protein n=1 Tax=Luminiphilus syltensis NOR5-1B TaxID=565045 RepID=B8KQT5_9GAMM|nr:conserved hypothetical protein [Luminiphilus syltensis NOR5-1B]